MASKANTFWAWGLLACYIFSTSPGLWHLCCETIGMHITLLSEPDWGSWLDIYFPRRKAVAKRTHTNANYSPVFCLQYHGYEGCRECGNFSHAIFAWFRASIATCSSPRYAALVYVVPPLATLHIRRYKTTGLMTVSQMTPVNSRHMAQAR